MINQITFNFGKTFLPTAKSDSDSSDLISRIGSGLRINGKDVNELEPAEVAKDEVSISDEGANSSLDYLFATGLSQRLSLNGKVKDNVANQLKSSLIATADQIEKEFGVDAADEFKKQILFATENKVTENNIANAVGMFFTGLRLTNMEDLNITSKITNMSEFLNKGLEILTEEGSATASGGVGLAYSMNVYFNSLSGTEGDTVRGFNKNIDWVGDILKENDEAGSSEGANGLPGENGGYVVMDMPSADIVKSGSVSLSPDGYQEAASWVRSTLGNDNAADYILENQDGTFTETFSTALAIVANENGQQALYDFASYLNQNIAPKVDAGGWEFRGFSPSTDFSKDQAAASAERRALGTAIDDGNGFWFGDDEFEKQLSAKGHQGVLLNFSATDKETGTKLSVPVNYDLVELYAGSSAKGAQAGVDLYV
jgi:hypothetical protein